MATGDTVLTEDSLSTRPDGLAVALTLPWYRSLWLSSVSDLAVRIDGQPVARDLLRVELGDRVFTVDELPDQLVVVVPVAEPPAPGELVDVEVTVDLRLPYMQIAPQVYVPNHAANRRQLVAR
jgi:hypothetical protein